MPCIISRSLLDTLKCHGFQQSFSCNLRLLAALMATQTPMRNAGTMIDGEFFGMAFLQHGFDGEILFVHHSRHDRRR